MQYIDYTLYGIYTVYYAHYALHTPCSLYTVYSSISLLVYTLYVHYAHCALHTPCTLYTVYSSISLLVYTILLVNSDTFILISCIVYGVSNTKATSPYRRSSHSYLTKKILPLHRNTDRYDIKQMRISILLGSLIYVRIFVISDAYKFSIYSIYCP